MRDLDVSLAGDLVREDIGRPAHGSEHSGDLLDDALDLVELRAEDLHGHRQPDAGREHLDPSRRSAG